MNIDQSLGEVFQTEFVAQSEEDDSQRKLKAVQY